MARPSSPDAAAALSNLGRSRRHSDAFRVVVNDGILYVIDLSRRSRFRRSPRVRGLTLVE